MAYRVGALAALLAASIACGDGRAGQGAVAPAATGTPTVPTASERPFPTKLDELGLAVPATTSVYAYVPGLKSLFASFGSGSQAAAVAAAANELAPKLGLTNDELLELVGSLSEAAAFGDFRDGAEAQIGILLRFDDPAAFEAAFQRLGLEQSEPRRFRRIVGKNTFHVGWIRELGLAVLSPRESVIDASFDALVGARPALSATASYPRGRKDLWLSVDLDVFDTNDLVEKGSVAILTIPLDGAGRLDVDAVGPRVPRLGNVLAPSKHTLAARLPAGASNVFGISLTRAKGKSLRDLISEVARVSDKGAFAGPVAEAVLRSKAKISLDDLERTLGDEIASAVYLDMKALQKARTAGTKDPLVGITVVGMAGIKDAEIAKKALAGLGQTIKEDIPAAVLGPTSITAPIFDTSVFKAQLKGDVLLFGVGTKANVDQKLAAIDKKGATLATDTAFGPARSRGRAESLGFYYFDLSSLGALDPNLAQGLEGLATIASYADLTVAPSESGLDATLQLEGAASLLRTMAGLAVHGVTTYLAHVKAAEAKNALGAIARGVAAAYERELADASGKAQHRLCASAAAVPQTVPKATTYLPSTEPNKDYQTGDELAGWRCLRFSISSPIRYRYEYRAGSGYKGPARGGPDPGPKGFEVSAEGDLDGDGKTSLFTLTGKVTPTGVELSTELFVADELE